MFLAFLTAEHTSSIDSDGSPSVAIKITLREKFKREKYSTHELIAVAVGVCNPLETFS